MTTEEIEAFVVSLLPIYTRKNPNPKSGKPDCPVTVREKEGFRFLIKTKLGAAKTEEERKKVIDKYTKLFSE